MNGKISDRLLAVGAVVALALAALLVWLLAEEDGRFEQSAKPVPPVERQARPVLASVGPSGSSAPSLAHPSAKADAGEESGAAAEEPMTEEERREAADEAMVDAFDALTDKWMVPSEKAVTLADVDEFVRAFGKVPKARREECLQRSLNLIPDENVMLLAGLLMDKSQPKELIELVFNDILNRDEDVKAPILQRVFADKTHPCRADTAWILDVAGEAGKKQNE